ncbi:Bgt-51060 [Blumeria graminis f. sp. tritici]|uniref:Bgt-51060 n=1 Tax=Blumeria graminis f. sp. tritici TaxID=62690 RepID=A0A9X9L9B7_BLUGR|nr:Bgt-51060 [Blumeria graminis f. sp. tritici]
MLLDSDAQILDRLIVRTLYRTKPMLANIS